MTALLDALKIILSFLCTFAVLMLFWFTPGPNAVSKEDVVQHGFARWEVTSTGKTIFVWNK